MSSSPSFFSGAFSAVAGPVVVASAGTADAVCGVAGLITGVYARTGTIGRWGLAPPTGLTMLGGRKAGTCGLGTSTGAAFLGDSLTGLSLYV